jgi:hypothetical protein
LLFAQNAGELLFGLTSLVAPDVIQGAQLGQHRLQPCDLDFEVLGPASRAEEHHSSPP